MWIVSHLCGRDSLSWGESNTFISCGGRDGLKMNRGRWRSEKQFDALLTLPPLRQPDYPPTFYYGKKKKGGLLERVEPRKGLGEGLGAGWDSELSSPLNKLAANSVPTQRDWEALWGLISLRRKIQRPKPPEVPTETPWLRYEEMFRPPASVHVLHVQAALHCLSESRWLTHLASKKSIDFVRQRREAI